jgi:cell division protein FtsW (lipid II flippase)
MTNEEIYKYADKKLRKQENKALFRYAFPMILGILGLAPILYIVDNYSYSYCWINACLTLIALVLVAIVFVLFIKAWEQWLKIRRNYIYNLVRADERKRCMTERYEYEDSK